MHSRNLSQSIECAAQSTISYNDLWIVAYKYFIELGLPIEIPRM